MKQEIHLTIVVDVPEANTPEAPERSYYYESRSKGETILVKNMHPCHMFNALRKAMNDFGTKILGEGVYQEMFQRLAEFEAEDFE